MVPEAFHDYFVASTGAAAALVGLLFVAVSIAPERTVTSGAPVERRAVALSAYTALLNAFFLLMANSLDPTRIKLVQQPVPGRMNPHERLFPLQTRADLCK